MQDIIAVIFDFDDTLAPDSTSGYLRGTGIDLHDFWSREVDALIAADWDPVPAYLHCMIGKAASGAMEPITRESLANWGRTLPLHTGVESIFERLRQTVRNVDPRVSIEFYLISSGIGDVVRNTRIAHEFTDIWASEFHYDDGGHAAGTRRIVSFTDKTRYLFHIQKGLIGPGSRGKPFDVNRKISPENLRIPMRQFIFVGDGYTDIPCFSLVTREKGVAIGVYDKHHTEKWGGAYKFIAEDRVKSLFSANYTEGSDLSTFLTMALRHLAEGIVVRSGSYQA